MPPDINQPPFPEQQQGPQQQPQQTNIFAILGLIFAFVFWPLGIVFSIIALVQINKNPSQKGKGLAIAGLIISIVLPLLLILLIFTAGVAFFGVMEPDRFLPEKCILPPGIACLGQTIKSDQITVTLQNGLGTDISNVRVSIDGCGQSAPQNAMQNGAQSDFNIPCKQKLPSGEKFDAEIAVDYDSSGILGKHLSGTLRGTVG